MVEWEGYKEILRQLYATADPSRIIEALNYNFTWKAITQKANEMGLHRQGWPTMKGESPFDSLGYCSACDDWIPHEDIPDDIRCPNIKDNKRCNRKLRLPLKSKFWEVLRKRREAKQNATEGTDV
jgi:hypothetical protein